MYCIRISERYNYPKSSWVWWANTGGAMASHSVKISVETYARIVLAASETGQTVTQWMEAAALRALGRQDEAMRQSQYRAAHQHAAKNGLPSPLARDFGLSPYNQ